MIVGKDLIQIAGTWCVLPTSKEPAWRSSISRAYYGAMHHCSEFFEDRLKVRVPKSAVKHEEIPKALCLSQMAELRLAASQLTTLGSWRKKADYELRNDTAGKLNTAKVSIEQAHEIESLINAIKVTDLVAFQNKISAAIMSKQLSAGWAIVSKLL